MTAPSFGDADIENFKTVIETQTKQLIENFKDAMHKAHNITHYPEIIRINGPPIQYWCMPLERKH